MIDCERLASTLFELDKNILYVGIIDERQDKVLFSKLRTGPVPASQERTLLELYPTVVMRAAERAQERLGAMNTAVFSYEKGIMVVKRVGDLIVVAGLDPTMEPPSYVQKIVDVLSKQS